MTNGNWSIIKPKELCVLAFKPMIYDWRLNLYDFFILPYGAITVKGLTSYLVLIGCYSLN